MNNICQNCKHWNRLILYKYTCNHYKIYNYEPFKKLYPKCKPPSPETKEITNFGVCSNINKIIYCGGHSLGEIITAPSDSFVYGDNEDYAAYSYTGENFGCIHFQLKESNEL